MKSLLTTLVGIKSGIFGNLQTIEQLIGEFFPDKKCLHKSFFNGKVICLLPLWATAVFLRIFESSDESSDESLVFPSNILKINESCIPENGSGKSCVNGIGFINYKSFQVVSDKSAESLGERVESDRMKSLTMFFLIDRIAVQSWSLRKLKSNLCQWCNDKVELIEGKDEHCGKKLIGLILLRLFLVLWNNLRTTCRSSRAVYVLVTTRATKLIDPFIPLKLQMCGDVEKNPGPVANVQQLHRIPSQSGQRSQRSQRSERNEPPSDRGEQGDGSSVIGNTGEDVPAPARISYCDLQVTTLNTRGLTDPKKVRHLVNCCYKKSKLGKDSIFLFQETFVPALNLLNYLWRGEHHLTPGTGNSLGCITLLCSPYKIIHRVDIGQRGHILAISKNDINKTELVVANIYAPNGFDNTKMLFFDELLEKLSEVCEAYDCTKIIVAGDMNLTFNCNEVQNRSRMEAEKRTANAVSNIWRQLNIKDGWTDEKADSKSFTWSTSRMGVTAFSTLDRICYSESMFTLESKQSDWAMSLSDHAAVTARLNRKDTSKSNYTFIPKLNSQILGDPVGRGLLDEHFQELHGQRDENWDPHVKLEYLKVCIRSAANMATGKIKAQFRDDERVINNDINDVVSELSQDSIPAERQTLLMHKLDDLRNLKRSLVTKIGSRLEQRTSRKWYNEGELSNKYFFNILNRKPNDDIEVLFREDGTETSCKLEIENEISTFYRDLYESVPDEIKLTDEFFSHTPTVPPDIANTVGLDLTLEDLTATLLTCKDSAPGPDGIPYSILKHFWSIFGPVLLAAWKYSLERQILPPSHKVSYLKLIPKAGKDTRLLANLRPITLSNTDHKLLTKTYSKRLTRVMSSVISQEQTAYIPGRLINDNIRSMLMTIDLANQEAIDGALISLDARKAFDSVDHRYIRRCLRAFGLSGFIPIFEILYKDLKSDIIVNGKVIDGYKILKGVKQGDALSCILFIMCMEPLLRNVKKNVNIEPVHSNLLKINIPKIYSFADDVNVIIKRNENSVRNIFMEYERLSENSGLVLNASKTEIMCFNNRNEHDLEFEFDYMGEAYRINSKLEVKINGILFQQDPKKREEANVAKVLASMEKLLRSWSTRRLTLLGKILIIKTYAISQLIYLMQSISLGEASRKAATKVIYKYLWNKNFDAAKAPDRIRRSIMTVPLNLGGFGMLDLDALSESLDVRSYARLIGSQHPFFSQIVSLLNETNFFNVVINSPVDNKMLRALKLVNAERMMMLRWPTEDLLTNTNFLNVLSSTKLTSLLTPQGKLSVSYFMIHRRQRDATFGQVTLQELRNVSRFLIYPEIEHFLTEFVTRQLATVAQVGSMPIREIYPLRKSRNLVKISSLSSKMLRLNSYDQDQNIICVYKQDLILNPGEVKSWTKQIRKLTSTRHKNIILRVAHGDIYSNERLFRFGLVDNPKCNNCSEPVESRRHRLLECPKATMAWLELNDVKIRLGLNPLTDLTMENLLGAKDNLDSIELALNAELLHRLAASINDYCPTALVKMVVRTIGHCENLQPELKRCFKEMIRDW